MTAMLPAHLTETLNNVGDAARALADEVRTEGARRDAEARATAETQHRQNLIMVGLLGIVVILGLGLLTIAVQNRLRSNQNTEIIRQIVRNSEQIADCTTVGGHCYEEGTRRQSDAIRVLVRAQIYYPSCKAVSDSDAEIEQCVMHRLLTPAPSTSPAPGPTATSRAPVTPAPSGD